MEFERELKAFRAWMKTMDISGIAVNLYYALLSLAGDTGWPETMTLSRKVLIFETKLGKDSIQKAGRELAEAGRIEYTPGKRGTHADYRLIYFYGGKSEDLPPYLPKEANYGGKSEDLPPYLPEEGFELLGDW
jgi:hypothetical protein